ncbi:MAG: outer membrane lipoprotein-sorting protein [Candidatus Marinimicrobia bacterium]|jgi:outer membrane lipoprotein-sorting protein|nr:outer membrane lipoprotein-sorting protein [Candidatus Neomarinimicrobiota bacterium]MBT3828726.1 outer membrane lipoprotein-sorting protein [Candidatus Neomarinimicrobiota bacterium]MBT4280428.1 outer membrane lipoprotein-sorting protein [Candidatus Neomarinimicrobiota bacterium]MBT4795034.1 outer membrane lipoprotein-sorting protein [Candidatus Neomarinimicrobiota bacterium]MBT5338984.1 outer membrane lipoprotein-sorting protein [Candidatus Neomarinimicrobiota bacterium]
MKTIKSILPMSILLSGMIFAQDLSGLEVIQKVYDRPTGNDMTGNLIMTIENSRGNQRVRKIKQFVKTVKNGEKKIMYFLSPADVKNTSFMTWSYDDASKSDDQWIYLPALKKVKRISSDSKGDYFMGSDFTYDDLGDRHPLDDTHTILREEVINEKETIVIESVPKDEEYMYARTVTWVVKDSWIGLKKEFYDEDDELLKILTVDDQQSFKDVIILTKVKMKNVQRNQFTIMEFSDVQIDTGIPNNKFTERMMKRGI